MSSPTPVSLAGLNSFNHFFLEYGTFLGAWNSFDVLVEVVLMRRLRLSVKESCILSGSLGFGAKFNILSALFQDTEENKAKIAPFSEAIKLAERNGFAHGFISVSPDGDNFTLVRREVKGTLEIRPKVFTPLTMQRHGHLFYAKFEAAMQAFNVTDEDLIRYQREVESYAKPLPSPRSSPPQSGTSFREAKKESRRKQRAQRKADRGKPK